MKPRNTFLITALAILCLAATAVVAADKVDETRKVDRDADVKVSNLAGELKVVGWDRDEVHVEGTLDPKAEKLDISGDKHKLTIEVKYPRRNKGDLKGSFLTVQVPKGCRLEAKGVSTDVSVVDVEGDIEVGTVSGDVDVGGQPRSMSVETVSGDTTIRSTSPHTEVQSVSGDVEIRDVRDDLSVQSVSGDVTVETGALSRLEFNAVSGDLDLKADPRGDARWKIDCHSGEVKLSLPDDLDANVDISTFSGDIDDGFGHDAHRTSKYAPGHELSYTQGGGKASLEISVFSGDVKLIKR